MRLIVIGLILSGFFNISHAQWNSSSTEKKGVSAEPIGINTNPQQATTNKKTIATQPTYMKVYWATQPVQIWPTPAVLNSKGVPQELPPSENYFAIQSQLGPRWIKIHESDKKNVLNYAQEGMKNGTAPYLWLGEQISAISVNDELTKSIANAELSRKNAKNIRDQANADFVQYVKQQRQK